ncbi:hypothetical protein KTC96_06335 [Clostridium estertheticum]|uniref:STM3941 family protein n=1 Tax=Clostridium estertheticum TaxID=238834 RepID=UPI001C7D67F7|nr:STM3941 family protein [Clostridium estertheticum]MBX4262370.1 hypothetical protein [Clostridium estertheticum]MCB2358701.1 hypothetical protein [Clostridium estertheticum]WLC71620.1 hypothetical protein KTC96_06335 [Clostridium estertheticum]
MNEIIIRENKMKVILLIILAIIMLVGCVFDLVIGIIKINSFYIIIGIIGTAFFGVCFFYIIKRALSHKPLLIVGEDGITDMSNATSVGFVAWEEIEFVSVRRVLTQKFIGITVYDIDKLMKRIPTSKQNAIKANIKFKYPPISIPLNTADMKFNKVLSLIQDRLQKR